MKNPRFERDGDFFVVELALYIGHSLSKLFVL
jgi:hypothetical protein